MKFFKGTDCMSVPNLEMKIFSLTLFLLRTVLEVSLNSTRCQTLTSLSLVWKWPRAVYSSITLTQVVSTATVQCRCRTVGSSDKGSRISKQKPDVGNYPGAELRPILFSTVISISFRSLLMTRKKTHPLVFSSSSLPSSSHLT